MHMRNTRSATSAFHAEGKSKYTNQQFISEYYPINFVAGDNYVFFSSLLSKPMHSVGYYVGQKALTWLYGPMRNPTRMFRNKTNSKMNDALSFLYTAAEVEYSREAEFLENFSKSSPMLAEIIKQSMTNGPDKYFDLINAVNIALKGRNQYEAELDKEIKRIENRREILKLDKQALKEGRHVSSKQGQTLTSEEYAKRNALNGTNSLDDTVLNPYYNLDGKKIFNSMFRNNSDFSVIAEKVILNYGSRLITTKNSHLHLDKAQSTALVKILIQEAYNILAVHYSDVLQRQQKESRSARKERIAKAVDEITKANGVLDQFFNDITNAPDPATTLASIAKQNGIQIVESDINDLKLSTKTFTSRIKKIWEQEKKENKTKLSFEKWREQTGFTKQDVREYVYMLSKVQVQTYYTNEGMAATDAIKNQFFSYVNGNTNAPTDVNAGMVVTTFSYEDNPAAKTLIREAEKKISQSNARYLDRQQKVTNKDSYEANTALLLQMQEEQQKILEKLKSDLKQMGIEGENLINYINIHETIKGYASIDATTAAFSGASFGTNITDELDIINSMLNTGGITPLDSQWLVFALINCGNGMIGSGNKHALEDYLSAYVGLLMFSDASVISQEVKQNWMQNANSGVSNIHLYVLNGKYVPSSYILFETAKALEAFNLGIEEAVNANGTALTLITYNPPKTIGFYNELPEAWNEESQKALEQTHLTMTFLGNFLGLLRNLQVQLSSL